MFLVYGIDKELQGLIEYAMCSVSKCIQASRSKATGGVDPGVWICRALLPASEGRASAWVDA